MSHPLIEQYKTPSKAPEVLKGVGITLLCNGVHLLIGIPFLNSIHSPAARVGLVLVVGLPVVQLLYVVPLTIRASRAKQKPRMAGMIVGALLSSVGVLGFCYYVLSSLSALR